MDAGDRRWREVPHAREVWLARQDRPAALGHAVERHREDVPVGGEGRAIAKEEMIDTRACHVRSPHPRILPHFHIVFRQPLPQLFTIEPPERNCRHVNHEPVAVPHEAIDEHLPRVLQPDAVHRFVERLTSTTPQKRSMVRRVCRWASSHSNSGGSWRSDSPAQARAFPTRRGAFRPASGNAPPEQRQAEMEGCGPRIGLEDALAPVRRDEVQPRLFGQELPYADCLEEVREGSCNTPCSRAGRHRPAGRLRDRRTSWHGRRAADAIRAR